MLWVSSDYLGAGNPPSRLVYHHFRVFSTASYSTNCISLNIFDNRVGRRLQFRSRPQLCHGKYRTPLGYWFSKRLAGLSEVTINSLSSGRLQILEAYVADYDLWQFLFGRGGISQAIGFSTQWLSRRAFSIAFHLFFFKVLLAFGAPSSFSSVPSLWLQYL